MNDKMTTLKIILAVPYSDDVELLEQITCQIKSEIEELHIESIEHDKANGVPSGVKGIEPVIAGQIMLTLAPVIIPPLFELLKTWVARQPTPIKIRVKVGRRSTEVEYDPATISQKELEKLIESLTGSLKRK